MSDVTLTTVAMPAFAPTPAEAREEARIGQRERPAWRAEEAATKESVKAAAEQIEHYLKSSTRELEFLVDDEAGRVVVRVRDGATGEVIRQIPGEEALKMARALHRNMSLIDLMA